MNNLFKGHPAIIVSAGPSLEKNIHLLREAKGKAVIIAVDAVLPTLVPAGVIPDIVVVLEANRTQFLVFQNIPLLRYIPAVFSGEVVHESLSSLYPGPMFFAMIHNHPISTWVQRFWDRQWIVHRAVWGISCPHSFWVGTVVRGRTHRTHCTGSLLPGKVTRRGRYRAFLP